MLVVGANPAWCHPVLFRRLMQARARRQRRPRLIVLDPRRSASADVADLHVPLRPGSDTVFLLGLLAELARRGRLDSAYIDAHTENFEALEGCCRTSTPRASSASAAWRRSCCCCSATNGGGRRRPVPVRCP